MNSTDNKFQYLYHSILQHRYFEATLSMQLLHDKLLYVH